MARVSFRRSRSGFSIREAVIAALTSKQRAFLKSQAHSLKPILQIGKEGVSEANVHAVRQAFNSREILKVKVLESAPESAKETASSLADRLGDVHLVQVIGRTVVLYRPYPDEPEIQLPR